MLIRRRTAERIHETIFDSQCKLQFIANKTCARNRIMELHLNYKSSLKLLRIHNIAFREDCVLGLKHVLGRTFNFTEVYPMVAYRKRESSFPVKWSDTQNGLRTIRMFRETPSEPKLNFQIHPCAYATLQVINLCPLIRFTHTRQC